MRTTGIIAACCVLIAGQASAQTSVAMYGLNTGACGRYLEDRRGGDGGDLQVMYIWGLVTGHNLYTLSRQVRGDLSPATINAYLEKFCRENPLSNIANGGARLVIDMGGSLVPQR